MIKLHFCERASKLSEHRLLQTCEFIDTMLLAKLQAPSVTVLQSPYAYVSMKCACKHASLDLMFLAE